MSETSIELDRLIKSHITPVMTINGFKKKGRSYFRIADDRIEKVIVESSSFSNSGEGIFWIALSIFIPEIANVLANKIANAEPKGHESGIFTFLGKLMPQNRQDSWKVNVGKNNKSEGQTIERALSSYATAWFNEMRNDELLLNYLLINRSDVAAILLSLKGELELAKKLANEVDGERFPKLNRERYIEFTKQKILAFANMAAYQREQAIIHMNSAITLAPETTAYWKRWRDHHQL